MKCLGGNNKGKKKKKRGDREVNFPSNQQRLCSPAPVPYPVVLTSAEWLSKGKGRHLQNGLPGRRLNQLRCADVFSKVAAISTGEAELMWKARLLGAQETGILWRETIHKFRGKMRKGSWSSPQKNNCCSKRKSVRAFRHLHIHGLCCGKMKHFLKEAQLIFPQNPNNFSKHPSRKKNTFENLTFSLTSPFPPPPIFHPVLQSKNNQRSFFVFGKYRSSDLSY